MVDNEEAGRIVLQTVDMGVHNENEGREALHGSRSLAESTRALKSSTDGWVDGWSVLGASRVVPVLPLTLSTRRSASMPCLALS